MNEYIEQIAKMLVDSESVVTDATDVGDEVCIVQTVKNALDWLTKARSENADQRSTILEMGGHLNTINAMLAESSDMPITSDDLQVWSQTVNGVADALRYLNEARGNCVANENEVDRLNAVLTKRHGQLIEVQGKLNAAQLEIGTLNAKLETATRNAKRMADEAAVCEARYEGMEAALRIVLELAGVRK